MTEHTVPRLYRTMKRDPANPQHPKTGPANDSLGVRVKPDPHPDVDVDDAGNVSLNQQGMSVAEHWTKIIPFRIPKRLASAHLRARGSNDLACWRMGEGPFGPAPLNDDLALALKADPHNGNVVPAHAMTIDAFQAALAATQGDWCIDEDQP